MRPTYFEIDAAYSSLFVRAGIAKNSVDVVVTRMRRVQKLLGVPPKLSIDFSEIEELAVERHRLVVRTRLVHRAKSAGQPQTVWLSQWVGEQLLKQFPGRW